MVPSDVHQLFQAAFNAGDADAVAALYENQAVLFLDGEAVIGREAIRQAYREIFAHGGMLELSTRRSVESQAGIALLSGDWTHRYTDSTSGTAAVTRGSSTEVVRLQANGRWCFVIDDPNSIGAAQSF
jgi:uncharacterized protein (TIGR02246 family)